MKDLCKELVLVVFLIKNVVSFHQEEFYTKLWVIEISKGTNEARKIAHDLDLIYHGKVGSLHDLYVLKEKDGSPHFASGRSRRRRRDIQEIFEKILNHKNVKSAEPQVILKRTKRDLTFNDPLFKNQWNLDAGKDGICNLDINVVNVWKQNITGRGVVVTVVDDGLEYRHLDIINNYDAKASYDYNNNDNDPSPRATYNNINKHGTRCAGQIAATANNKICGVGVAYQANLGGIRMFDGSITDSVEGASLSHNPQHIEIYSVSWGPDDDGSTVDGPRALARKAIEEGVRIGRRGLGSLYIWATGNGGHKGDHCSCDGFVNMIETISISAVDYCGRVPYYAEACSGILAVTYSSGASSEKTKMITTTDLHNRCTGAHTATSASAPVAAGILALALQVNKNLTWRDVQHLIVRTSNRINPYHSSWVKNGRNLFVSDYYGFGALDAERLVKLAVDPKWKSAPPRRICKSGTMYPNRNIVSNRPVVITYNTTACIDSENSCVRNLEHVKIILDIESYPRGGLEIHLISPSKTKAPILKQRTRDSGVSFINWSFMSVFFWDENPAGAWNLQIVQKSSRAYIGNLKSWSIEFYGTCDERNFTKVGDKMKTKATKLPVTTVIAICGSVVCFLIIVAGFCMKFHQNYQVTISNNNSVVQHRFSVVEFTNSNQPQNQ